MFSRETFIIEENTALTRSIYRLRVSGNTSSIRRAGQFVNIQLPNFYLRRPISISSYDKYSITLIYKTLGEGTEYLTKMKQGEGLDLLVGLGNGFDLSISSKRPLLVGGGVGIPPLYQLALDLSEKGKRPIVVLGFNTAEEIFYQEEFSKIPNCKVYVATMDGSFATKGTVINLIEKENLLQKSDYLYSCGPMAMLRALYELDIRGQFSLEERMGCGFGSCMGCTCKTKTGYKRVCHEGPVFLKEDLLW